MSLESKSPSIIRVGPTAPIVYFHKNAFDRTGRFLGYSLEFRETHQSGHVLNIAAQELICSVIGHSFLAFLNTKMSALFMKKGGNTAQVWDLNQRAVQHTISFSVSFSHLVRPHLILDDRYICGQIQSRILDHYCLTEAGWTDCLSFVDVLTGSSADLRVDVTFCQCMRTMLMHDRKFWESPKECTFAVLKQDAKFDSRISLVKLA